MHVLIDNTDDEKAVRNGGEKFDGTSKEQFQALGAMSRHTKLWAYKDMSKALIDVEMHKKLVYNDGKCSQFGLVVINSLQYMPHLRIFKCV